MASFAPIRQRWQHAKVSSGITLLIAYLLGVFPCSLATAQQLQFSPWCDLSQLGDAFPSDEGRHGGTQLRVCSTSHGTYVAFLGRGPDAAPLLHVLRVHDQQVTPLLQTATDVAGSNSVHVIADDDENVFVIAAASQQQGNREVMQLTAYELDRQSNAVIPHSATRGFPSGSSYGYSSVCLDSTERKVYALYSGGDRPGYFCWVDFDLVAKRWSDQPVVATTEYRHCYHYCFAHSTPDAAADPAAPADPGAPHPLRSTGMWLIAERDVRNETVGVMPDDPRRKIRASYVWDELRIFAFADLKTPQFTATDIEAAVYDQQAGLFPTVSNNFRGDCLVDAQGRLHVAYFSDDNDGRAGSEHRYAVFDQHLQRQSLQPLPYTDAASARFWQTSGGALLLVVVPYDAPARVVVWQVPTEPGGGFLQLGQHTLAGEGQLDWPPQYAGLAVSAPRGGTPPGDQLDCLLPVGDRYFLFRIRYLPPQADLSH